MKIALYFVQKMKNKRVNELDKKYEDLFKEVRDEFDSYLIRHYKLDDSTIREETHDPFLGCKESSKIIIGYKKCENNISGHDDSWSFEKADRIGLILFLFDKGSDRIGSYPKYNDIVKHITQENTNFSDLEQNHPKIIEKIQGTQINTNDDLQNINNAITAYCTQQMIKDAQIIKKKGKDFLPYIALQVTTIVILTGMGIASHFASHIAAYTRRRRFYIFYHIDINYRIYGRAYN